MGIMIRDPEVLADLAKLAERDGTTRTEALKRALANVPTDAPIGYRPPLFPRDRVRSKTWTI